LILLILGGVIFFILSKFFNLDLRYIINFYLYGDIFKLNNPMGNYIYLFFIAYGTITVLFLMSVIYINKINRQTQLIFISALILFLVYVGSNKNIQVMRGIAYFIPLYYLVAIYSIQMIKGKKIKMVIILLMFISVILSFQQGFFKTPDIPNEVTYRDYKLGSNFIKDNYKSDNLILISSQPQANLFFDVKYFDIYLLRDNKKANYDKNVEFYDTTTNSTRSVLTNIIVIENYQHLNKIIEDNPNKKIIVFLDTELTSWVTPETMYLINNKFNLIQEYKRVQIYQLK